QLTPGRPTVVRLATCGGCCWRTPRRVRLRGHHASRRPVLSPGHGLTTARAGRGDLLLAVLAGALSICEPAVIYERLDVPRAWLSAALEGQRAPSSPSNHGAWKRLNGLA